MNPSGVRFANPMRPPPRTTRNSSRRLGLIGREHRAEGGERHVEGTGVEGEVFSASAVGSNLQTFGFGARRAFFEQLRHCLLYTSRNWDPFDRSIDVRITRIRRKIEKDPAKPQIIKTVWGKGYLFVPDKEE